MLRIARRSVLLGALLLAACVVQNQNLPAFGTAESSLPPPAPGMSRIYFYRLLEPYEIPTGTIVYLNGAAVGYSRNGTVMYRDVPAGTYDVSVLSRGAYPYQFMTLTVASGQAWYVRIESLLSLSCAGSRENCPGEVFTVQLVDPAQARLEMAPLGFDRG
jgi:uncharacterized protein DUF2846